MIIHRRFFVDENGYIIDTINPANSRKVYCWQKGVAKDDRQLRELVLWERLGDMFDRLKFKWGPTLTGEPSEMHLQYADGDRTDALSVIFNTIRVSHLNTFDPWLSVQNRFDGSLRRPKVGMHDFTSLSLFVDDVEGLLRDLYGEVDSEVLDLVRDAVLAGVKEFAKYVCTDLWQEHCDAQDVDESVEDGFPLAGDDLAARAREVRANPSAFSEYTVEFVKALDQHWPGLGGRRARDPNTMKFARALRSAHARVRG
jgi:hypothetical protein